MLILLNYVRPTRLKDLAERRGRYLDLSGTRRQRAGGDSTERSVMILIHQILIGVIKPARMRWAGHVEPVGKERGIYGVLEGKTREKETT